MTHYTGRRYIKIVVTLVIILSSKKRDIVETKECYKNIQ